MQWSKQEVKELEKYFNTSILKPTLFLRIHKINPDRSYEAILRQIRRWIAEGWEKEKDNAFKKLRIGYLDIETTDLRGDWGHMLTWYIKKRDKNEYDYGIITKKEIFDEKFDERIVRELLAAFDNYDILYTHWGVDRRFDIPFIRTRAYYHEIEDLLPDRFDKFIMDTWPIARNKLALFSNRLDNIAQAVKIKGVRKTILKPHIWQLARVGNKKALEYIADHNKKDVQVLEKVHKKLEKIERPIYRSI